jgi:hypothetical protein
MAANSGIAIAELDFDTIKTNLKSFFEGQAQFQDYDFAGSNLNVLLDVLAYNTYYNNFYLNMLGSEMFLDTAIIRDSIISHAKELNYLPRSSRGAEAALRIEITPNDTPASITIPKGSEFTTVVESNTYTFATTESQIITADTNGDYIANNVTVREGDAIEEFFAVTSNTAQRFVLSNQDIDTRSIAVKVRESNTSSTNTSYTYATSLFGLSANSNVFFLQPAENEKYEVVFGNDVAGKRPVSGNLVEVAYQVCNQAEANRASAFTSAGSIQGYSDITVTTLQRAQGGSEPESVADIKFNAPRNVQVQERAVTKNDYKILLQQRFPEIEAITVFGGEDQDPPQYGRVVVSVDLTNADGIPDITKQQYKAYIDERTPVSIESVIIDPEFSYIEVSSHIHYNVNVTNATPSDIKSSVLSSIETFANNTLQDFEKTLRYSKLVSAIDDADSSIISNETAVRIYKNFIPTLATSTDAVLNFQNKLKQGPKLNTTTRVSTYVPAIQSEAFTFGSSPGFFIDNGDGLLQIVTALGDAYSVLDPDVGTVDYETGKVTIKDAVIAAYTGAGIKVYARPYEQEIAAKLNTILRLESADATLTIAQARE